MREFKFRVWDKKKKEFVELSYHKQAVLLTDEGFEMSTGWDSLDHPTFGTNDSEGYPKMSDKEFKEYQDRFIYLQFTGLQDKNGKDIYEGGIVKHNARISENPLVVVFIDGAFCIGKKGIRGSDFNSYVTIRDAIKDGLLVDVNLELEVVGNIFEHKHLLK